MLLKFPPTQCLRRQCWLPNCSSDHVMTSFHALSLGNSETKIKSVNNLPGNCTWEYRILKVQPHQPQHTVHIHQTELWSSMHATTKRSPQDGNRPSSTGSETMTAWYSPWNHIRQHCTLLETCRVRFKDTDMLSYCSCKKNHWGKKSALKENDLML